MKSSRAFAQTLQCRRNRITAPTLLALGLLVIGTAGCGGGGGGSSTSGSSTTTGGTTGGATPAPAAPTRVSAPALGSLTASLTESQAAINVGGSLTYTFTLTNTSSTPVNVTVDTVDGVQMPKATLRVTYSSGKIVYPIGAAPFDTPPAPPSSGVVTILPNGQVSLSRTVSVFSKAGTYQAVATFTVASSATDTPQTVTLPPLAVTAQ